MAGEKLIATNRKARHDYTVLEAFEAGIKLKGTEVKSLREARVSLRESFARIERGEMVLYNLHISPYSHTSDLNYNPTRTRKLLLHKTQIRKLEIKTSSKGLTLVPLKMYFKHGLAKVELALCKGKRSYDRRSDIKKKEADREVDRALKERRG